MCCGQLDLSLEPAGDRGVASDGQNLWFHIQVDREDVEPLTIGIHQDRGQQEATVTVGGEGFSCCRRS